MIALVALAACVGTPPPQALPASEIDPEARPELLYFVLVDRFANGNPANDGEIDLQDPQAWHGGDLAGVRQKLDHLEALGVTRIWLSPVFASRQQPFEEWGAFHGYWITDPTRVEPRFGTEEELRALADALHQRGMKLDLDMVWNHVAWESPVRTEHPEWFHPDTPITDWEDPIQRTQGWVHGLPDLDQEEAAVAQWLLETSQSWIDRVGPDGFRIDAVRHMPGAFLQDMSDKLHARAGLDFRLLGESFTGDPWLLAESRKETGLDAVFDFPLRYALVDAFCHGRSLGRVAAVLSMDRYHDEPGTSLVTFLDNHDLPRVTHECGGDLDRVRGALDAQFALRGVPMITYGTEAALDGGEEPANRADLPWTGEWPLMADLQQLVARRAAHPALALGETTVLAISDDRLLLRQDGPDEALTLEITREGVRLHPPQGETRGTGVRQVQLRVEDSPATDGLMLVGTGPQLGNWSPSAALPSTEDGSLSLQAPVGDVLEYKVLAQGPEGLVWEPGENRYLLVTPGAEPLALTIRWGDRAEQATADP